ncbi:Tetratricopeptide repeat-containing protein [Bradyrhizobium lablabi]|uniref:Tetratricopeptide repeat-containing protein n=1 Tax=Bradyrhizobium lablabi TaxID=722472 RepID=A0A1M7ALJ7_9BRAD|nr:tetratricopeptide repeat protein [Bradyrhizobium lablabi]SHL43662.1 Tetratricopeptide repeat-containing protein [Bradyrhizobium lablabi]
MPDIVSSDRDWAPRLAQESRLRQLEELLARRSAGNAIDAEIERAVLLGALNRRQDAQHAFVDILRRAPANFSALNEFGALLTQMGAIDAACRVYSEAIAHHPQNPIGHVNLANLLFRANRHTEARERYEAALRIDPEHAQAHQGLGAVLSDLGERARARHHFQKGFGGHAISTLPYRGTRPPIALLQLVSSGGGNIPTASFLDDRVYLTSVVIADYLDPQLALPPHQLIFNAIGDADLCEPALQAAARLTARTSAPVINDPGAVMKTGRIGNAQRLGAVHGVVTPRTITLARDILAGPDGASSVASDGFTFPLLLRSPGYHTGRNFILVPSAAELAAAAASLPGDDLLVIEYLDARGKDGKARKYRVMIIAGEIYPLHLAISGDWKVHYFTSDMADKPDHRLEEASFLEDMRATLGDKAVAALERIRDLLGLDYAGVDFGLGPGGDVLLFEANATMVVNPPDPDRRWAYRRTAITRILDAVTAMILRKSARPAELR